MAKSLYKHILNISNIDENVLIIILGLLLYFFNYYFEQKYLITNIIITCFVLAVYDTYLKQILLFNVEDDYYKFVINNIITIVVIDLLITIIKNSSSDRLSFMNYFNLAFACLFYETIIFKMYNYNNMCNQQLRNITKTILRLTTIHILSNFLNDKPYDKTWFDFSFGQMFNFALFNSAFDN